jgi:hypothetical protein
LNFPFSLLCLAFALQLLVTCCLTGGVLYGTCRLLAGTRDAILVHHDLLVF